MFATLCTRLPRSWFELLPAVTEVGYLHKPAFACPSPTHVPRRQTLSTFLARLLSSPRTWSLVSISTRPDGGRKFCKHDWLGATSLPSRYGDANASVGRLVNLCETGQWDRALQCMDHVERNGIGAYTTHRLYRLLQECIKSKQLAVGRRVHSIIVRRGLETNNFLGSHVIRMFAVCGRLSEAQQVFSRLPAPDVHAWAATISANAKRGQLNQALKLYQMMRTSDVTVNTHVFVAALQACRGAAALAEGKLIHGHITESGVEVNGFVCSALIDMYSKCGSLERARAVFEGLSNKDLVSWTAMTMAYVQQGYAREALQLFEQMRPQGVRPDKIILSTLLKACCTVMALDLGELIHAEIVNLGLESNVFLGSGLIAMYAKCGDLHTACQIFDELPIRNVVLWNALITGHMQNGYVHEAFLLFQQMETEGVPPDKVTFSTILKACGIIAALRQGNLIHMRVIEAGYESDPFVRSTLIDMYAKCGSIEEAEKVFRKSPVKDIVIWTAMISGHAQHGSVQNALQLFKELLLEGIEPTHVTFLCLLAACSRAGLLEEGCFILNSMSEDHGVIPGREHYACVVDLLCRAGHLSEAEEVINSLPYEPDTVVWLSLLSACQNYVQVEPGRRAFESILRLNVTNTTAYVMMSNIYAAAGMHDKKVEIRNQMQVAGIIKEPGRTWMELDDIVHTFVVDDRDHPERKLICRMLRTIETEISKQASLVAEGNSRRTT